MDLHRASSKPDWEQTTKNRWNLWQRVAAATGGIATPSNFLTLLGLVLVAWALVLLKERSFLNGAILLTIGRFCDIADGWVAAATGTKSPLGESFDAVADKLGTFFTLLIFFFVAIAPRWAVLLLVLPQIAGTLVILYFRRKQVRIHPTRAAKTGMALAWLSLLGFAFARGIDLPDPNALAVIAGILTIVSVLLSGYAVIGYATRRD